MDPMDLDTLRELDIAHLMHPITEFRKYVETGPRIVRGGSGIHLEMADGRRVIDGFSGLFNINVGHGRHEIADAVHRQMRDVPYYPAFYEFSTETPIRLAKRLVDLFPEGRELEHLLFTSGGSDANETAFRTAKLYHGAKRRPERQKIISRRYAYHGITRSAASATTLPAYHVFSAPEPTHVHTAAPYCFRCDFGKTYPDCALACVDDIEAAIQREGPETIAAVIAEPIQGTGGIIVPPKEYFLQLQEICRRHDILLILDEVITGFGRTGHWFGMDAFNIFPDIVSFAKGITSGYLPLGGIAITDEVYRTIKDDSPPGLPYMFGLTYNNHPTACAAAMANLDIIEREHLVENAASVGSYLKQKLEKTFGGHPVVADIRGIGMLAALECTEPGTKDPVGGHPMKFPSAVANKCWDLGLIARALWDNVALAPPLCATREDIDEMVAILERAFHEVSTNG